MPDWWIDESDPGPQPVLISEALQTIGTAMGTSTAEITRVFTVVGKAYGKAASQIIEDLRPVIATFDKITRLEGQPNLNKNGRVMVISSTIRVEGAGR